MATFIFTNTVRKFYKIQAENDIKAKKMLEAVGELADSQHLIDTEETGYVYYGTVNE